MFAMLFRLYQTSPNPQRVPIWLVLHTPALQCTSNHLLVVWTDWRRALLKNILHVDWLSRSIHHGLILLDGWLILLAFSHGGEVGEFMMACLWDSWWNCRPTSGRLSFSCWLLPDDLAFFAANFGQSSIVCPFPCNTCRIIH